MDLGIKGKRALVTGSTAGIGEATAKLLAAEGARVVVHGRREPEANRVADEIRRAGGEARVAIGDLSEDASADRVASAALGAFGGGIDILVNNAGVYPAKGWFNESAGDWTGVYNTNVSSMVRMINRLVPGMIERRWGRVVAIASGVATRPMGGMGAYSATKAANVNLAVSLAQHLAGTGVTSNAVSPGLIMTPGVHGMFDSMNVPKDVAEREKAAAGMAVNPVGRPGQPIEIAEAVAFLCSMRAAYVMGQNLRVDGGFVPTVN